MLQISSNLPQSHNLQQARRATTPSVLWLVALLHILQLMQVQAHMQSKYSNT